MLEPNRTAVQPAGEGKRLQPLRHRLAHWVVAGLVPPGLAPSAVAAAFVRATGRQPARDPERRASRAYSAAELRQALAELGRSPRPAPPPLPPPADPLTVIWAASLQRVALPSTRMLLSQQCRLVALRESGRELLALVAVRPDWLRMVAGRRDLVAAAMADTLARPVALELQEVGR